VLERLPDFETRVRTQAKRLAMSDLLEKRAALVRPDEDRMSILFSAISKLNIWLRETSEGQAVFNDYEVKARETLAREISKDMLFTELPMSASTVEA
jgi:hypothetical protein